METYIVLADVDSYDRKEFAEFLENSEHESIDTFVKTFCPEQDILMYNLTDFMDACNNQEIDLNNYWVTYVNIG